MALLDKYDLIVVGGGAAGVDAAYLYQRQFPDHSVLILERKGPGRTPGLGGLGAGLTGRSGGHLMPGFEADYSELERLLGPDNALKLYSETLRTSDFTAHIIAEESIRCGLRHGYWIVDESADEFSKLNEFMCPRRKLYLPEPEHHDATSLQKHMLFAGYNAGLYFRDIASFDTPKFVYGLAEAFLRRGGHIAQGCEYKGYDVVPTRKGRAHIYGQKRFRVRLANRQELQTNRIILAGGDILTRQIPFLHKRTVTVYTGRIGVRLSHDDFKRISPNMQPLSGCDSDLKSNQNPLEGDFLWFSLRQDGYLAMGFGGCFSGLTAGYTRANIDTMMREVKTELYKRLPFLADGKYRIKPTVGGLNTSSNLLPIIGPVEKQDGVYAIAAQSGVGLNQSMLMAKALVDMFAGNACIYEMLLAFERGQVIIPTPRVLRRAAIEIGLQEKSSPLASVRAACALAHRAARGYTRIRSVMERGRGLE